MVSRVYQIKGQMFLITMRISIIYYFFLAHLVGIIVKIPLEPLICNSKIRWLLLATMIKAYQIKGHMLLIIASFFSASGRNYCEGLIKVFY
jgi:hypothetical protein